MRVLRFVLCCVLAVISYGCAHFDPTVLETAEAIPQGAYKLESMVGTTQDIGAWIPAEEDSLWRASRYLLRDNYTRGATRNRLGIGLGDNMELLISGQISVVPERGIRIKKYWGGDAVQMGYMARVGVKKVWPLTSSFACAVIPSFVAYNSGSVSKNENARTLWVGSEAFSVEMPIIASWFFPSKRGSNAVNLTLRPGYTAMDRDIRNTLAYTSGPDSWYAEYIGSRLETAHLYRMAGMVGMDIKRIKKTSIKFEIGAEAVYHSEKVRVMPIFAVSWSSDTKGWPPWRTRP